MTKITAFSSLAKFLKKLKRKNPTSESNEKSNPTQVSDKNLKNELVVPLAPSSPAKDDQINPPPPPRNPKNETWNKAWDNIKRNDSKRTYPKHHEPQKKKKSNIVPVPKIDKKGFRVLTDQHDLNKIFIDDSDVNNINNLNYANLKNRSNSKPSHKPEEDFETLFKIYQLDRRHNMLLDEKKKGTPFPVPITISERLKAYPGPQSVIDMHGHTAAEAESQTDAFIWNARYRGLKTVRIIVGKGLHSEKKAVLPDVVETKLIKLKQQKWVLDYKWENKDKRKSGALIVYLIPMY